MDKLNELLTKKALRLDDRSETYFDSVEDFAAALCGNGAGVEAVRFGKDFLNNLQRDEVKAVFDAVGKLPCLKRCSIRSAAVHVDHLGPLLQGAQGLEAFELLDVRLEGSKDDFTDWEFGLHHHPNLKELILRDFTIAVLGENSVENQEKAQEFDAFVKELSSIPNLEVVVMQVKKDTLPVTFSGTNMAPLCKSTTLKDLHFANIPFGRMHFSMISWALCKTPLESLSVTNCGMDDEGAAKIASALSSAKHLVRLDLSCNKVGDEGVESLADGLSANKQLKYLSLSGCKNNTAAGENALKSMLENNSAIEHHETPMGRESRATASEWKPSRYLRSDSAMAA